MKNFAKNFGQQDREKVFSFFTIQEPYPAKNGPAPQHSSPFKF